MGRVVESQGGARVGSRADLGSGAGWTRSFPGSSTSMGLGLLLSSRGLEEEIGAKGEEGMAVPVWKPEPDILKGRMDGWLKEREC